MANFNTIGTDTALTDADKILVGQADGDDVGVVLSEVKRFINPALGENFKNGIIVPMYMYPTDSYTNANYAYLMDFKRDNRDVPVIAIINPNSGPAAQDGEYTMVIKNMIGCGIKVIGYVSTDYRNNTTASVKSDIDLYKSEYPELQGIFFDEQSDGTTDLAAELAYYKEVADYSRLVGFGITVSNPGVNTDNSFYDIMDIIVEHETDSYPDTEGLKGAWPGQKKFYQRASLKIGSIDGELNGGSETLELREIVRHFAWFYVTDDVLPNPWDTVSSLFPQMLLAINGELQDPAM
jgi:hypothetical protein